MSKVSYQQPMAAMLRITDEAFAHVMKNIEHQQGRALRISLEQKGCTGWAYVTEVVVNGKSDDISCQPRPELTVYIAKGDFPHINGSLIDLAHKALGQTHLIFINPQQESECGCGESVKFKGEPS